MANKPGGGKEGESLAIPGVMVTQMSAPSLHSTLRLSQDRMEGRTKEGEMEGRQVKGRVNTEDMDRVTHTHAITSGRDHPLSIVCKGGMNYRTVMSTGSDLGM